MRRITLDTSAQARECPTQAIHNSAGFEDAGGLSLVLSLPKLPAVSTVEKADAQSEDRRFCFIPN